jgi:hypothetical protein
MRSGIFRREPLMKAGSRKTTVKKTMRVATVFSGAAACATAFGPAAAAATAATAPAGHAPGGINIRFDRGRPKMPLHGARPAYTVLSGNIESTMNCGNTPKWVHTKFTTEYSVCFGFKGSLSYSTYPLVVSKECGGTNHGFIESPHGDKYHFYSGNYFVRLPFNSVSWVHISGWNGGDTCSTLAQRAGEAKRVHG